MVTIMESVTYKKSGSRKTCSMIGCEINQARYPGLHFFKFPVSRPSICKQWVINCENEILSSIPESALKAKVVCEKHFTDNMFTSTMKTRLNLNAVPTRPSSITSKAEKVQYDKETQPPSSSKSPTETKSNYVTCCALACTNTSESHVLTRLPSDPERRQQWLTRINRDDLTHTKNSALCQIHFEADAWEEDALGVRVLKAGVLPTLYLNGEGIKSWVTLDKSGNIEDVRVRNSSADNNDEINRDTVYIKQEVLEPDIEMLEEPSGQEMLEEPSGVKQPFEAVYLHHHIEKQNTEEMKTNINVKHLNESVNETIVPEIFPGVIKTEALDITDDQEQTFTTSSCPECGQHFEEIWDLEQHLVEKHSESGSTKISIVEEKSSYDVSGPSQSAKPSVSKLSMGSITTATTTAKGSSKRSIPLHVSTSQTAPITASTSQGDENRSSKQYLILIPKTGANKNPMFVPVTRPPTTSAASPTPSISTTPITTYTVDNSETFTLSLAQFPESMRIGIKRKMLEVVETVQKFKIKPENVIILHKAETTT